MTMSTSRNEPNRATCPDIDRAIALMEDLRESNHQLREWGNGLVNDLEEKDDEIKVLEEQVSTLEDECNDLKKQLAATPTETA